MQHNKYYGNIYLFKAKYDNGDEVRIFIPATNVSDARKFLLGVPIINDPFYDIQYVNEIGVERFIKSSDWKDMF